MNNDLDKKIESYLFWKAEPVNKKDLLKTFSISNDELENAIQNIAGRYSNSGLTLKITDDKIAITTSPETSDLLVELEKADLNKELSKATLETLAIVLYMGPIKKPEIDHIRGVSSQFTLRNLQIRGLVEKIQDPKDSRTHLYKPTIELLNYLGLSKIEEMPDYENVKRDIESFVENQDNQEKTENAEQ